MMPEDLELSERVVFHLGTLATRPDQIHSSMQEEVKSLCASFPDPVLEHLTEFLDDANLALPALNLLQIGVGKDFQGDSL